MGLRKNCWLKVWEIKRREERYTDIRGSTSRKNKDDEYITDFNGFIRLVGEAHKSAENLSEGDRIQIEAFEVTNRYDKDKDKTFTNFTVFKYGTGDNDSPKEDTKEDKEKEEDGELPFR